MKRKRYQFKDVVTGTRENKREYNAAWYWREINLNSMTPIANSHRKIDLLTLNVQWSLRGEGDLMDKGGR